MGIATHASEYLQQPQAQDYSAITRWILTGCTYLDNAGAWEWSLRSIAVVTAVLLGIVRIFLKKKRGVDWYALIHALITSVGSLAAYYLDVVASQQVTGTPEPLRTVLCHGPMTSLHRILPAITMGYSIFDLLDGMTIGWDFALHGVATLAVFSFFCELNLPHAMAAAQCMEVSTVFLSLVRADFFPPAVAMANMGCFALTFFIFRLIAMPYIWVKLMAASYQERNSEVYQSCIPSYFLPIAFGFGLIFHALDLYWFIKIVKKIRRKLHGHEAVHDDNELGEKAKKHDVQAKKLQ